MNEDALDATFELVDVLAALDIPDLVGGSLATTAWGEARFTRNVDLVVEMTVEQAERLGARLEGRWYANVEAMQEAIARHRSFNLVRLRDMVKIDVFVPPREELHAAKWERGIEARLDPRTERTLAPTRSPRARGPRASCSISADRTPICG